MRERPDLLQRFVDLCLELVQTLAPRAGIRLHQVLRQPQPDAERDEPLLGPVVEVALDAPALVSAAA